MFWFVSGTAVFCTLLVTTNGAWPIVIASGTALVAAHVAGTFVGTRLRDTSDEIVQWKASRGPGLADAPRATPEPVKWAEIRLPPATPLATHATVARHGNRALVAGLVLGAFIGAGGILGMAGDNVTWPGVTVGAISCGVIGAWMALLLTSFWEIGRHAWRDAVGKSGGRQVEVGGPDLPATHPNQSAFAAADQESPQ